MTRTSTNNSSSSTSQPKPSPPSTVPSLTPQTSYASASTPSFSPSNAIDDFVLFPEDTWSTDTSLAGLQTEDLGQFNFDINDLDQYPIINDPAFDFSFDSQLSNFQFDNNPQVPDQYGLDQWASSFGGDMPVHTRPHPSGASLDTGELDTSFLSGYLYDSSAVSPMTQSPAQGFSPDLSLRQQPQSFQNTTTDASPLSSASDWSPLQASSNASPAGDASTPASSQSSGSSQLRTRKRRAAGDDPMETLPLANARGSGSGIEVDPSDLPIAPSLSSSRQAGPSLPQVQAGGLEQQPLEARDKSIAGYAHMCQSSRIALRRLSSASLEAASLSRELGNVQAALQQISDADADLSDTSRAQLQTLGSLLQVISTVGPLSRQRDNKLDPEFRPDYLLQCQVQARRVVRSLCATINYVEAQNTGTSDATDDMNLMLVSGRNVHAFTQAGSPRASLPASLHAGIFEWVESTSQELSSSGGLSEGSGAVATTERGHAPRPTADLDEGRTAYRQQSEVLSQGISTDLVSNMASDGHLASGIAQRPSLLDRTTEASPSSSLLRDRFLDIGVQADRHQRYGEEKATIDPAADNAGGRTSYSAVMPAVNSQGRPSDNVTSSGAHLVSQPAQTAAATSSMASLTSQQTLSYAAYQLVLPLLATLFASYIVCLLSLSLLIPCTNNNARLLQLVYTPH